LRFLRRRKPVNDFSPAGQEARIRKEMQARNITPAQIDTHIANWKKQRTENGLKE